jgi:hypothetical protein
MSDDGQQWRPDIDALEFRPGGHGGHCVVHRLAFRKLLGRMPEPEECAAYFARHRAAFHASATAKIRLRKLAGVANLHLTSRDIRRELTSPAQPSSVLTDGSG